MVGHLVLFIRSSSLSILSQTKKLWGKSWDFPGFCPCICYPCWLERLIISLERLRDVLLTIQCLLLSSDYLCEIGNWRLQINDRLSVQEGTVLLLPWSNLYNIMKFSFCHFLRSTTSYVVRSVGCP